ncbi:hypothetical protein [Virgisporangium aurantiacum]|uniref:Uncharacterized protein n=1 Tax=Virgisporangium aurantiacum TaxID=175570 RepID=A0A8J3ZDG1_9ACTN|nr:hypothetical protein [Virgisporangium aurantiacum]GIJ59675.1 hypothetical protein Vau01_071910 [Virgisporangium aurantiacum]
MTERVDLDRLADYVGGALDGTPDAAEVRGLVDTDPEWAAAHDDLAAAMSSVSADLRAVGEVVDAVPEDVVARLDDVLRNLGSSPEAATVSRAEARPTRGPGAVGPGATGPGATGPGRARKRRTARWAAGLSAAAAVIAFGVGVVATFPTASRDSADTSAGAPAVNEAAPVAGAAGGIVISGRDYQSGSFGGLSQLTSGGAAPYATSERNAADSNAKADSLEGTLPPGSEPPELTRFRTVPAVLRDCLDAVQAVFGGQVRVVDLARFEGKPAVVVLLDGARAGDGRPLVVAAGQNCGQPAGTTDELFHGPLT